MPTVVQFRRGTTAQNNSFTGAAGELSVDTTLGTIRVHNGIAGGNILASIDAVQTLSNKTLSAPTITGTLSSTGFINTTANISAAVAAFGSMTNTGTSTVAVLNSTGNILSTGAIHNSLTVNGATTQAGTLTVTSGFINSSGNILATGAVLSSLTVNGALTATGFINTTANISAAILNSGAINSTGLINTTGNIICASISAGTYVGLSSSKINTNASNVTVDSSYVNVAINGSNIASIGAAGIMPTANASGSLGSTTVRWNNIVGVSGNFLSVNANYADLAENYTSDSDYAPGTVLVFGGESEVTQSHSSHDTRIAGVVSTNPAYLMNGAESGIAVALQGRVPCQVLGPVGKGDRVVASHIAGVAQALDPQQYQPGCIIGKALQTIDSTDISIIEVVVGRL